MKRNSKQGPISCQCLVVFDESYLVIVPLSIARRQRYESRRFKRGGGKKKNIMYHSLSNCSLDVFLHLVLGLLSRSTIGRGGDVTNVSPFWEGAT